MAELVCEALFLIWDATARLPYSTLGYQVAQYSQTH